MIGVAATKAFTHTVGEKKDSTKRYLWSKTTLITGNVGGACVDSPSSKTDTFFLGPWHLVCQFIEISNQMEVNGEVLNFGYILCNTLLYNKIIQSLRLRHLPPFDWKFL